MKRTLLALAALLMVATSAQADGYPRHHHGGGGNNWVAPLVGGIIIGGIIAGSNRGYSEEYYTEECHYRWVRRWDPYREEYVMVQVPRCYTVRRNYY